MTACSIKDCSGEVKARGLCDRHYLSARRKGELERFAGPGRGRRAPEERKSCPGVSACGKPLLARGLCGPCYEYRTRAGLLKLKPIVNAGKSCKVKGCGTKAQALGYCVRHYERFKKYSDPLATAQRKTGLPCSTDGCSGLTVARALCRNCYQRWKKRGSTEYSEWHRKRFQPKIVDGYVLVWSKGHKGARKSGYVLEHRLVMEEALGRPLLPGENVHHKNGVKSDNRFSNLELWVTTQPAGQRPHDIVVWAREMLRRYPKKFLDRTRTVDLFADQPA